MAPSAVIGVTIAVSKRPNGAPDDVGIRGTLPAPVAGILLRMSRVIRWHERPLAPAAHERPVVVGLEIVMVLAESVQQIEQGELPSCPRVAMVGLESGRPHTSVRCACRV